MEPIFHITEADRWFAAVASGIYTGSTRGKSLADVGFIHCSFEHQVRPTGELVYGDATEPLLVLTIDPALVDAPIKLEDDFPHIYGPLLTGAVTEVQPFHA